MPAPTVYRWDDAEAPIARGERDSLIEILTACLVNGYGTKQAAGWTLEHVNVDNTVAAFRNNPVTGTGFFLQVNGSDSATAYEAEVQGFEVMTSESDGVFPFYTTVRKQATSTVANVTAHPWILIADDRAFWFITWPTITTPPVNSSVLANAMFFGDIVTPYQDDGFACALCAPTYTNRFGVTLVSPSGTNGAIGAAFCMPRKKSGVQTPFISAVIRGGGPGSDKSSGQSGIPFSEGDAIFISRPHLNDGAAYTFRGWIPGYYYPCHPLAFNQLEAISADGNNFLSFRHKDPQYQEGNTFISLDDWRA